MSTLQKVRFILEKFAEVLNITNFELIYDEKALTGNGMLSECYTGQVCNKNTGELTEVFIKLVPSASDTSKADVYFNEYWFYSTIWPELEKFQKYKGVRVFNNIPRFYCGSFEVEEEYIAMENLGKQNYSIVEKRDFLDEDQIKQIFRTYGKYHALNFSFKSQNKEKYEEIIKPLKNMYQSMLLSTEPVQAMMRAIMQIASDHIRISDEEKADKIVSLFENIKKTCTRALKYEGDHSALVHGDCWSNNIMFKYENQGDLQDIKLIDHQLALDSTPVHDLSYFFYSGASKKDFDNLEEYLNLYYESFSTCAKKLGSNPANLLTLDALKSDWKKYSLQGVLMGLMVWQIKLTPKNDLRSLARSSEERRKVWSEITRKVYASDIFKRNISDILIHACEYNII